ncbi:unnamed protein product [Brachionus calyciflorus]|uniref:CAP-Gly domain-containing protein n=1 Tax=Brachionus calyciflorus TaxID=104777 RepID=A0A813PVB4_9BILA|nr:unnamed protein product [Brachionus calyciflorus]
MPTEKKLENNNGDVIDDLVDNIHHHNYQRTTEDNLVINMVHSELEDDDLDHNKIQTKNYKSSYQDSDLSTSSDLQNSSSSLTIPLNKENDFKNESTDYLNVLKYELKEKDLDIVQLQKEINELQLENKLLRAKIPFYNEQMNLLDDEMAKTIDTNNPYIKEMLIFKKEKDVALEELMKAQDTISRLSMEKSQKCHDMFTPDSPDLLKKKLKTYERQIRELENENEKYSCELVKTDKNFNCLRQENAELRNKLNENKILYEREQNLLVDMAELKNELKKLKQANGQLIETNKRLIDELNSRVEHSVSQSAVHECITSSTQTYSDQDFSKNKKTQSITEDNDLNTTYNVNNNNNNNNNNSEQFQKVPKHCYHSRNNYNQNENYSLAKTDDYLINNFRPFNQNTVHSNHNIPSPKKSNITHSGHSVHSQRVNDFDYDNHHHQFQKNFDYNHQQQNQQIHQHTQAHRKNNYNNSRYDEQEFFRPESSDSVCSNRRVESRSKSLRRYSSNETLDEFETNKSRKSLKINVMRDIKSAQKLRIKRDRDPGYRHSTCYYEQPVRNVRRSLTFTNRSTRNLYEPESDFNSTPSNSHLNFNNNNNYNHRYQDEEPEYATRSYRSKSVDRVTAMERKMHETHEEINQKESISRKRPFVPLKPDDIRIGDFLKFSRPGGKISKGMVKYIGPLPDRSDVYFGLELESEEGKHDGIYNDKRYFQTKPNKGVFVSFSKVVMAWG